MLHSHLHVPAEIYIYIYIYIYILDTYRHNEQQTQEDIFNKIFTPHFIARVRKGYSRFACERELETEHKLQYFDPHCYDRHVVSFLFSWCSTGALGSTLLGAGFLYCILSASSLDPNSSGPKGPFGLMWLSLPHLVYNSVQSPWHSNSTGSSNSTELYNRSTSTRSLKSNV